MLLNVMRVEKFMFKKAILLSCAAIFGVGAHAEVQPLTVPQFILSSKVSTENKKMTDVPVGKWQLDQDFALQYNLTQNIYLSGDLGLVEKHDYNYRLTAGAQLPYASFTPYFELSYYHPVNYAQKVDYDIGVFVPVPGTEALSLNLEFDDPLKNEESFKVGASYAVTANLSISASYSMRFDNKSNGASLGLSYTI